MTPTEAALRKRQGAEASIVRDLEALPSHVWIRLHDRECITRKLRVSLVEYCNYRCFFCHNEGQGPLTSALVSSVSMVEICRVVALALRSGVSKVKLTGGEPLLYRWDRATVTDLVRDMCALRQDWGFDLSMTTNGSLLPTMAHELKRAGLDRVTVSLTTLNPHTFAGLIAPNPRLLKQSMRGLQAARDAGLDPVKINMVLYQSHRRNIGNLDEIKTVTDLAVPLGVTEIRLFTLLWHERFAHFDDFYQFFSPDMRRSVATLLQFWGVPAPVETTEILTRLATSFADRMYPKVEFGVDLGSTRLGFEAMKYGRLPSSKASQEGPYAMRLGADGALRPTLHGPALFDLIQGVRSGLPDDTLLRLYASAVEEMP